MKTGVYHVVFRGSLLGIITPWSVPGVRESVCVTCRVVFVRVGASREAAARSGAGATRSEVEDHVCVRVAVWITAV